MAMQRLKSFLIVVLLPISARALLARIPAHLPYANPGIRALLLSTRRGTVLCDRKHRTTRKRMIPMDAIAEQVTAATTTTVMTSNLATIPDILHSNLQTLFVASNNFLPSVDKEASEALAGPFFGLSLFPYLAFLYFLNVPENRCPKGVVVGFATCLLFVILTIPAAIAAKLLYGATLADCDWLHGSAESMLTITNLVTVIPFRQALAAKDQGLSVMPNSATSYAPMVWLVVALTALATATVLVPALSNPEVHTPYLNGFLDVDFLNLPAWGAHPEPDNALTVATWIIHVSSLVEFLVAMGFCWRWADVVQNPTWKGLTWGLIPLHSSGITACVSHFFYNGIAILVPFQALLTCVGNTTAAYAAYRIARSNGWVPPLVLTSLVDLPPVGNENGDSGRTAIKEESQSLVGFEDLGDALAGDNDYTFLIKLFAGCAAVSYLIKYGETFLDFPYQANLLAGLAMIAILTALNAYKWNRRSKEPNFKGWF